MRQQFDRRGKALAGGSSADGSPPQSIGFLSKISVAAWSKRLEEHSQGNLARPNLEAQLPKRLEMRSPEGGRALRTRGGRPIGLSSVGKTDGEGLGHHASNHRESQSAATIRPASSGSPSAMPVPKLADGGVSGKRRREALKLLRGSVRERGPENAIRIGVGSAAAADKHPALTRALWVLRRLAAQITGGVT